MWWGAIILGFVGSAHCLVMCGPLISALPGSNRLGAFLVGRLIYNLGRILTYTLFGFIVGSVGRALVIPVSQQSVSIIVGVFMCLLAFSLIANRVEALGAIAFQRVNQKLSSLKTWIRQKGRYPFMLFSGIINGMLPCGLVYIALAASLASSSPALGAVFMLHFGLGTLPAMLLMALIGQFGQNQLMLFLSRYGSYYVAFIGFLLIIRGLDLQIPYLSPAVSFFYPNLPPPTICN